MTLFPLTFAVFYQSIIYPNININKNMTMNALFAGAFCIERSNPDYIAPGTYSDYIRGKRPIRSSSVTKICNMSPEELIPRINLLGLQDMPSVQYSIKNLLKVTDISTQLRNELLSEINDHTNEERNLAKTFQVSLKCNNKRKYLSDEEILLLNRAGEEDFISKFKVFFLNLKIFLTVTGSPKIIKQKVTITETFTKMRYQLHQKKPLMRLKDYFANIK